MKNPALIIVKKKAAFLKGPDAPLAYALLVELLVLGYLAFFALFTLETLLPTFISPRLSLVKFLFWLILLTYFASSLGRELGTSFPIRLTKKSPLLWLGGVWLLGILVLSLLKFPIWAMIVIIVSFFLLLFWFGQIFFSSDGEKD